MKQHLLQLIKDKDHEIEALNRSNDSYVAEKRHLQDSREREAEDFRQTIKSLQDRSHQLHEANEREIDKHRKAAVAFERRIQQYEETKVQTSEEHRKAIALLWQERHEMQIDKDRVLQEQGEVLEALQDEIRQLNESKDRDSADHHAALEALHAKIRWLNEYNDRESNNTREALEALQETIIDMNEVKSREIEAIKQTLAEEHEEALSNLRHELEATSAKPSDEVAQHSLKSQLEQVRATLGSVHASNTELRQTVDETNSQLDQIRATLGSVHASNTELRHTVDDTQSQLEKAEADLISTQRSNTELRQDLDKRKQHHEQEVSRLKKSLEDMSMSLSGLRIETIEAQEQITQLEREKTAAQSALQDRIEWMDRLSEEKLAAATNLANDLRQENQRLAEKHYLELEASRTEYETKVEYRLLQSRVEHKAHVEKTVQDLQEDVYKRDVALQTARSTIESLQAEAAQASNERTEAVNEELASLRASIKAGVETNVKLTTQLNQAQKLSEERSMRIRELDSALKVTTAELVELRTDRPNGSTYSGNPVPKSGLRSSRWAKTDTNGTGESDGTFVGEESSSHIQGQVCHPILLLHVSHDPDHLVPYERWQRKNDDADLSVTL